MSANDKLHRWLDLIAALLRRRYPVRFEDLRREVPAYADPEVQAKSIDRMFERDKDELRDLGVAIETVMQDEGTAAYRLKAADFYLPLLALSADSLPPQADVQQVPRRTTPATAPGGGLLLTPDACDLLRRAAARVAGLGHPELAADAQRAMRKLQVDVARFAEALPTTGVMRTEGDDFDVLGDALARRKRVTFQYHGMARATVTSRVVEPYGLVFLTGHWYLIGRDVHADALRQFRVSRIRDAALADRKVQHPDFTIPPDFDLSAHAASRQAWELGDAEAVEIVVVFTGDTGQVLHGRALGHAVPEHPHQRRFAVRRLEAFLRWLLTFGGDARPVSPPAVCDAWNDLVRRTRAAHAASVASAAEAVI